MINSHHENNPSLLFSAWALAASAAPAAPAPVNVATYNLRNSHADDGPNAWPARKDMVKGFHADVLRYGALSDSLDRRYPSDRFPVVARVVFK